MREFEFQYDDGLRKGLRKHHRTPRNFESAVDCHNMRISEAGLDPYTPLTNPFTNLPSVWPLPQIISAKEFTFLITRDPVQDEDYVYTFDPGTWTLTQIAAIDERTYDVGDRFEIADFGEYVLLTNGVAMIRYDTELDVFIPFVSSSTIPLMRSVCAFKGQGVAGGVLSSWHSLGTNSIIWTDIGSMDFTPGRKNEAGFRDAESEVHRVRRLGDHVIVYGSKALGRLSPVGTPAPTFAWKEITEFGIYSSNAIGGGLHQHAFIDEDGYLWTIDETLQMKKHGYQEFMKNLDLDEVVINYDRVRNDFYISDGELCYLFTPFGLSSVHQCVSGLISYGGENYGVFIDNGDITFRWVSNDFDMGFRSLKTVNVMEVGASGRHTMRAGLDWRSRRRARYTRAPLAPVNDEGVAYPVVSGSEFRAVIESSSYLDVELDYLKMRWKMTDLRNLRGVYSPPPRGQ